MKRYRIFAIAILFVVALAGSALGAHVEQVEERFFPLTPEGYVSVENVSGNIYIHAWSEEKVKMVVTKSARAFSEKGAQELLETIEIEVASRDDQLDIITRYPFWSWWRFPFSSSKVDYELWIPLGAEARAQSVSGDIGMQERDNNVWVKTVSGAVELEDIRGDMEVKTTSGHIQISESKGTVTLHSVSGEIKIEKVEGDMVLNTTSGKVTLREIEGSIEARTVSGRVNILKAAGAVKSIHTISGDIWVELEEVEATASDMLLSSISGDVILFLPENISADIEANTTSGKITSEFKMLVEGELGELKRNKFRGTIGEGGIAIRSKTTSGNISLRKLTKTIGE